MIAGWVVIVSLCYAALLFAVAWVGDRYPLYQQHPWLRSTVYSLALAVYCSSWTFYGAVGTAARYGIGYLPIYLGPLLLMIFGWRILERLALIARSQNTVSIADFIASRYGRSQRLAAIVAGIAVIAAVPYLALQYKAVAISLAVLGGTDMLSTTFGDPALYVAALMALFSILFGTRQVDATEHRPGLMLAVAFESLVKLIALVIVGLFAVKWFSGHSINLTAATSALIQNSPPVGFIAQTLLAFVAIICLPRQFHLSIVECGDVADIRRARWMFSAYLIIICLMVLPIASAGVTLFGINGPVAPDSFVLALPQSQNNIALALIAYVGGFSAATGMVIVANVALSTMVSNDLVMPFLLRRKGMQQHSGNMAATVLWIRRAAIIALAGMAYGYYRASSTDTTLASFGLITFAAVAQFAPGLFGGLFWRQASRQGVEIGLIMGFVVWVYTLLLPSLTDVGWFDATWLTEGLFGVQWLRPHQLFGLDGWDSLSHGTFWSLLFNITAMVLVSTRWRPGLGERLRAEPFLNPYDQQRTLASHQWQGNVLVQDLQVLAGRIVGEKTAQRAFFEQARVLNQTLEPNLQADSSWMHFTELLLAAAVGAASARRVLTSALQGSGMELATVVAVLDEAGQELRFNRNVLLTTLENIDQGVSVMDADMKLVAWNQRYQQLFGYPAGMLYVGRPASDLIRFNASKNRSDSALQRNIDEDVAKRIVLMRTGSSYIAQRTLDTGQVIEQRGQPLPSGGYVTSYSDVTEYKRVERELREINETLEQRVSERTHEAELAQKSRTQFLTAVSHDVLQPINAARLFASALREEDNPDKLKHLAERVDTSLRAAEELLDGLLDISRLDSGILKPEITDFDVSQLLQQLIDQYAPMASRRGLILRMHSQVLYIRSDRHLMRRVLQNFLANALRYTRNGRIILSARPRGATVVLQVYDTGPGIPPQHLRQIYEEFRRYEQPFDWDGRGLGLGLSICQRIALLLDHKLDARSKVDEGSMFSIATPRVTRPAFTPGPLPVASHDMSLLGLRVLYLDNDPDILAGMQALLGRWGIHIICATTIDGALEKMSEHPEVLLVDYHLHDRLDGLDSLDALRAMAPGIQGALLTADGSDTLKQAARNRGYRVLTKPVKPASLRAFLSAQVKASM